MHISINPREDSIILQSNSVSIGLSYIEDERNVVIYLSEATNSLKLNGILSDTTMEDLNKFILGFAMRVPHFANKKLHIE
jgi:hypothetical protein